MGQQLLLHRLSPAKSEIEHGNTVCVIHWAKAWRWRRFEWGKNETDTHWAKLLYLRWQFVSFVFCLKWLYKVKLKWVRVACFSLEPSFTLTLTQINLERLALVTGGRRQLTSGERMRLIQSNTMQVATERANCKVRTSRKWEEANRKGNKETTEWKEAGRADGSKLWLERGKLVKWKPSNHSLRES